MLEPHFVDAPPRPGATGATADVFSFGTVLWELLERKLPWTGSEAVRLSRLFPLLLSPPRSRMTAALFLLRPMRPGRRVGHNDHPLICPLFLCFVCKKKCQS